MDELIESIRAGVAAEASPEARAAGANACRTLLTALEAVAGQPMSLPVATPSPVAAAVAMLRGVPPDQLLDLAIARLRAALPADAEAPRVEPLKFHIIQLPSRG